MKRKRKMTVGESRAAINRYYAVLQSAREAYLNTPKGDRERLEQNIQRLEKNPKRRTRRKHKYVVQVRALVTLPWRAWSRWHSLRAAKSSAHKVHKKTALYVRVIKR